jgi:uroporphyrinogen III methyltransferase/synthase
VTVYLVGAGPGDPGLLTLRGHEVLSRADVVFYDRLSEASLLDLAPATAERVSVGKTPRGPSTPQDEINNLLVEKGRAGLEVVRLKGGDSFLFSRGGEEAAALAAAGIPFEVVPGVSSAIAAPAYAGVPVTHRGLSTSVTFVTGHEDPWAATDTDWESVARVGGTIVVLMGAATRGAIAERLMQGGLPRGTPVAAVTWGTRPEQRTVRTTLEGLGTVDVASPAVIVIGAVAALDLGWFEQRPLFGTRVQVTGGDVASKLRAVGADVVHTPAIAIEDIEWAPVSPAAYDWVLFTSANAVDRFVASLRDSRAFGAAKIAAIGPSTADALARWHVVPDVVASEAVAESLLQALPLDPCRALLPRALEARDVLPDGLSGRGWTVDVLPVYRTARRPISDVGADAITFMSSSAVEAFEGSTGAIVACIGPVTAATARERGMKVAIEADPHTGDGLVEALVAHFR